MRSAPSVEFSTPPAECHFAATELIRSSTKFDFDALHDVYSIRSGESCFAAYGYVSRGVFGRVGVKATENVAHRAPQARQAPNLPAIGTSSSTRQTRPNRRRRLDCDHRCAIAWFDCVDEIVQFRQVGASDAEGREVVRAARARGKVAERPCRALARALGPFHCLRDLAAV